MNKNNGSELVINEIGIPWGIPGNLGQTLLKRLYWDIVDIKGNLFIDLHLDTDYFLESFMVHYIRDNIPEADQEEYKNEFIKKNLELAKALTLDIIKRGELNKHFKGLFNEALKNEGVLS